MYKCADFSGKEQFKCVIGMIDSQDSSWESRFTSIVDLDSLKVSYLHDPELNIGRLDETELKCLFETFHEVSELCYNDQTFQLLVLLTLLDTEDLPNASNYAEIKERRNIYMKLFQRKLLAANCSSVDYSSFRRTLIKIKILSALMEAFMH
jgi:hypothetical protein